MSSRFSWGGYFLRLLFALVVVFATYNPLEISYYHWVTENFDWNNKPIVAIMFLVGMVILIGWVMFLRATYRSLGAFGTMLACGFFAALIWVLVTLIPVPKDNVDILTYLIEFGLAGVLSAGMSWSHVRRRMSGQLDVDETDM